MKSQTKTLETSKISKTNSLNDSSFSKVENVTIANEGIGKSPQILFQKKNNNKIRKNLEPKNLSNFVSDGNLKKNKNQSFIKTQNKISLTTNLQKNNSFSNINNNNNNLNNNFFNNKNILNNNFILNNNKKNKPKIPHKNLS